MSVCLCVCVSVYPCACVSVCLCLPLFHSLNLTIIPGDISYTKKFKLGHMLSQEVSELRTMDSIEDDEKSHMSRHQLPTLLHLFKMLQLSELVCTSPTVRRCTDKEPTFHTINEIARLVGRAMAMLPYFLKPDDDKAHLFIQYTLRALSTLLGTPHARERFHKPIVEEEEEAEDEDGKGRSSKGRSGKSMSA